jgi:hypothetical protein
MLDLDFSITRVPRLQRLPFHLLTPPGALPLAIAFSTFSAVDLHLRGIRKDGLPIPEPSSSVDYIDIAA